MSLEQIESQAKLIARENRENGPDIAGVYWFPNGNELRLVELTEVVPQSEDGEVRPFYFLASPAHGLPAPSAIAMIRPDEFGRLRLPEGWGDWNDAVPVTQEVGSK